MISESESLSKLDRKQFRYSSVDTATNTPTCRAWKIIVWTRLQTHQPAQHGK